MRTRGFGGGGGGSSSVVGGAGRSIYVPAADWIPRATSGPGTLQTETATFFKNYDSLEFDGGGTETADYWTVLPADYNGETFAAKFFFTSANGEVIWAIGGNAYADQGEIDVVLPTSISATKTALTGAINIASASGLTIPLAAAGKLVCFSVLRNGGGDGLATDASLIGVLIYF